MTGRRIRINSTHVIDGGDIDLDKEAVRLADGSRLAEARAQLIAEDVLRAVERGSTS